MTARQKRTALAKRVVKGVKSILVELKDLETDIRQLWVEFANLPKKENILGCSTKKQFCEKHLGKTPRAVRYMLDGGNHKRGETVSPLKNDPKSRFDVSDLDEGFLKDFAERTKHARQARAHEHEPEIDWRQLLHRKNPPAADIKEFASLGRREAARKYHTDRAGGDQERMVRMNQVADWLESLAGDNSQKRGNL